MKALLVITGRGMGGDAVNALNIAKALEEKGVQCELALDYKAPGLLFKNNGYSWHKLSVPQAGGHAATKIATFKAGAKTFKAALQCRSLIKKLKIDIVVGIIGGGAVVGCVGAKLAGVPAVGIIDTPLDTKICTKLNTCIVLPEAQLFKAEVIPPNVHKSFFPLTSGLTKGNAENALKSIKKLDTDSIFDKNKASILFSSGSSLFEGMAKAISNCVDNSKYSKITDNYNLLMVGLPLEEEYLDLIDFKKVINLGYIDWIKDLYELIDLAVLTDDGVMIQEAIACELPSVALTRVKYGRYHNMAGIFPGAVIESDLEDLNNKIEETLLNLDEVKNNAKKYSNEVISAGENIAEIIINEAKNS
ncbi:MAG: glycosyltransferase [Methanobrevibacter sp.]|jgi:UDP-N-acetylglucosamine--N-acetylmuramyl-(pentapeptide) pyrophosphoryl-undecaprenol N-acetylglucosamine transferase|nr:glycosyltransferase [Methanobrevibacter sp.]